MTQEYELENAEPKTPQELALDAISELAQAAYGESGSLTAGRTMYLTDVIAAALADPGFVVIGYAAKDDCGDWILECLWSSEASALAKGIKVFPVYARTLREGLDDGPHLPLQYINAWKKPLVIKAFLHGLSARECGLVFDVSHDTAARWIRDRNTQQRGET